MDSHGMIIDNYILWRWAKKLRTRTDCVQMAKSGFKPAGVWNLPLMICINSEFMRNYSVHCAKGSATIRLDEVSNLQGILLCTYEYCNVLLIIKLFLHRRSATAQQKSHSILRGRDELNIWVCASEIIAMTLRSINKSEST